MVGKCVRLVALALNVVHCVILVVALIRGVEIGDSTNTARSDFIGMLLLVLLTAPLLNIVALSGILKGLPGWLLIMMALAANTAALLFWTLIVFWPLGSGAGTWEKVIYVIVVLTEVAFAIGVGELVIRALLKKRKPNAPVIGPNP